MSRSPALLAWSVVLALAAPARGERLPVKAYTTADGLAQSTVYRVARDSRGFLWLCTRDGLSRFDGYAFANYGVAEGLPHPNVNHLLEARDGSYWIATNGGGVARLELPAAVRAGPPGPLFRTYPVGDNPITNRVNVLYQDRTGALWAGTDGELFRLDAARGGTAFAKVDLGLAPGHRWVVGLSFAEDRQGRLWAATSEGVFVLGPGEGQVQRLSVLPRQGLDWVRALLLDREGRLWIGHLGAGVLVVDPARWNGPEDLEAALVHRFTRASGLAGDAVHALYQSADGHVWIGTEDGLSEFDGRSLRRYGSAQGVIGSPLSGLTEDLAGNLWAATPQGALKISRSGFRIFDQADGLSASGVRSLAEDEAGTLYVVANDLSLHSFDGRRFHRQRPPLPVDLAFFWPQAGLRDRAGRWWLPTGEGLFLLPAARRFDELAAARPTPVLSPAHGLDGRAVMAVYESASGDLWISVADVSHRVLRWEGARGAVHAFTPDEGVPEFASPTSFAEDRAGGLWAGLHDGGLLRFRGGRFQFLGPADGVPAGQVTRLHVDRAGRLWIATTASGVGRIDDPAAERPRIEVVSVKDGLASNNVSCLAEDRWGRLYLGSGRGVDRLDPESGHVVHYREADGLDVGDVEAAWRDRSGHLWFGGARGLSRLVPGADPPRSAPAVHISGLRVPGLDLRLAEVGHREIAGLELGPGQNQVVIDFLGLGFAPGETLRYRYRLQGGQGGWSPPTRERTVHYANLAPGRYRFEAMAVGPPGSEGPPPASVAFVIHPPLWRRWWFLTLAAAALTLAATAAYRYRVARLLEVAHMRVRIATDLHDDIGANLTKIAILSEVARQQSGRAEEDAEGALGSIARISRESVASMSDIVWAISPGREGLGDLVRRMRRHAEELFAARGIALDFRAPDDGEGLRLGMDTRRDVFLVFKEAVNNAARHAACSRVEVELQAERGRLRLRVADDGRGLDAAAPGEGHGLPSMRRRARGLEGTLEVAPRPGGGTEVLLEVPCTSGPTLRG